MVLSFNIKYLDVNLDPKLNWRIKMELSVKKASIVFYACKKALVRTYIVRSRIPFYFGSKMVSESTGNTGSLSMAYSEPQVPVATSYRLVRQ